MPLQKAWIHPLNYGKIVGQTDFFSLGKITIREEKHLIQTSCTPLKKFPSVESYQ